jgi:CheY-like chemotaxis protein
MSQKNVLLVEDNEGDILLLREAFEDLDIDIKLNIVKDGEEALGYLYQQIENSEGTMPDIVLLDINIPKINGLEVLKKLKEDRATRLIPVIMLTTSSSKKDIETAYNSYANSYIVKPDNADNLDKAVHVIDEFWFHYSALPTREMLK